MLTTSYLPKQEPQNHLSFAHSTRRSIMFHVSLLHSMQYTFHVFFYTVPRNGMLRAQLTLCKRFHVSQSLARLFIMLIMELQCPEFYSFTVPRQRE